MDLCNKTSKKANKWVDVGPIRANEDHKCGSGADVDQWHAAHVTTELSKT